MAVVILVALIGAIVYFSRQARREYLVSAPRSDRDETWTFNVRDMRADLRRTASSKLLETYDLRRIAEGRWEIAVVDDADAESRTWLPCEKAAVGDLEAAHRRYNGDG